MNLATHTTAADQHFNLLWTEEQLQWRFVRNHFEALAESIELLFDIRVKQEITVQVDKQFLVVLPHQYILAVRHQFVLYHITENIAIANLEGLFEYLLHILALIVQHGLQTLVQRRTPVAEVCERAAIAYQLAIDHHGEVYGQGDVVIDRQANNYTNQSELRSVLKWCGIEPAYVYIYIFI